MRGMALLSIITLSACAAPGGPYPLLQPRAAEATDPRVPIVRPMNNRPVSASLAERLSGLIAEGESGDATFNAAASEAEKLAGAAGPPQSEGWITAEEALTTAIAARKTTATALGDIDALAASALQTQGGIAPNDLKAIQGAAARVTALDQRQADRIKALQQRLGL